MNLSNLRTQTIRLLVTTLAIAVGALSHTASANARGGPPNIMNSEGYQRALREERKLYQPAQPIVAPTMTRHRRHRHHHYRSVGTSPQPQRG